MTRILTAILLSRIDWWLVASAMYLIGCVTLAWSFV